ncbi:early transcription factor large subunit [Bodo saltans virus]|uniref:Early transcription factor large subunit n=1 Tax=Bodo saltans virus TaxID=2024608 RepID=A0A2H4UV57_9VIRU|nr:early transcription factor large subunit [Bodo saltans virus]ATZ80744.1 early transcription factor large subunit [Bodo saltans virus]
MNDPIKIVWKYKNKNRRVQYSTYIFVGNMVPKDIMKILTEITDLNFYDTISTISKNDYKKMEDYYGIKWYEFFFNRYHIDNSIDMIKESKIQKKDIIDKYGNNWYETHISSRKLIRKEIIYSYEALVKYENEHRKTKERGFGFDDIDESDFRTVKSAFKEKNNSDSELPSLSNSSFSDTESSISDNIEQNGGEIFKISSINQFANNQYGGKDDDDDINNDVDDVNDNEDYDNIDNINNEGDENESTEYDNSNDDNDENNMNDFDENINMNNMDAMDEIEEMYDEDVIYADKKISETENLIKKALNNDNILKKNIASMIEFDKSNDDSVYDNNLKDVFKKYYVTMQYIFKDDSIKSMRQKICCSLKMNTIFGDDLYLTPFRQYFWIEYDFEDKINKIAIGQKWMRRNELLSIDVEPNNNMKVYEELRGQLKLLRDNMKRYNNKIRAEDEDNNILFDYDNYLVNNEIYMIDTYNELGVGFSPDTETLKNLQDVYFKLYFRKIRSDDIKSIIDCLNKNGNVEIQRNQVIFETINNDLILENEIDTTIETVRRTEKYQYLFKDSYITQSVIHVSLHYSGEQKLNLYKIFNKFELDGTYPFIQYQTTDGNIVYKFGEKSMVEYFGKNDHQDLLTKWFENAPYGISIKTKAKDKSGDKFLSINLNENGRIEYKTQWKEEDTATVEDINKTYVYIYNLINKLNGEKNGITFIMPKEKEFKHAFINSIQKFELPKGYTINHNDLSNFSRYFFSRVVLVIDPQARQSKIQKNEEKSKYGTYLRYKKVSKYDNQSKNEQRIMHFIKNYEFTEKHLITVLSNQFNITELKALEEYERVKHKYPNLKKARKILKKLDIIPKYKPPGIGIDIQGKEVSKYKIRISGARDKVQLDRITTFMNILMHLYVETYLLKKPEKQILKKKLELLKNIATRRNKVDDFVKYSKDIAQVKQMTKVDKMRIGFKPEKGQNQWTRSCQNSGDNKKRRPQQYNSTKIGDLLKRGYYLNKKKGVYERKVMIKERGKKKEVTLQAIKFAEYDETGELTGNEIFYTCDPEENGEHFYIGFLTKSKNPFGQCMPCGFKKDQMNTTSKKKREFIENCLNPKIEANKKLGEGDSGDKLYILQDTNKLHDGRLGFLPRYLDIYFNFLMNKQKKIKHHYLIETQTGYFLKYGSNQDAYQFLNCIGAIYDITVDEIKKKIITFLKEKDKSQQYFISIGNGDIKSQFKTQEDYIFFLENSDHLSYEIVGDIISLPNVLTKFGMNIVIFNKKITTINDSFDKEKTREDFFIQCQTMENVYGLTDKNKDCLLIIKEGNNYYPIIMVKKDDEISKNIEIYKKFNYTDEKDKSNIVNHINDFYQKSCIEYFIEKRQIGLTAKMTRKHLESINKDEYMIKYQYIDSKNKCKYLITKNDIMIPVYPSGSLYDVQITKNISKYIKSYDETVKQMTALYNASNKKIPVNLIGVYLNSQKKHTDAEMHINGIMSDAYYLIPVLEFTMTKKQLTDKGLLVEQNPQIDEIDNAIEKSDKEKDNEIDERIKNVNLWKYESESYELFRLEFSNFINSNDNQQLKLKLENIITNKTLSKMEKAEKIKLFLYKIIDNSLYQRYKLISNDIQTGGGDKFVYLSNKMPNINNYKINNDKNICSNSTTKDECSIHPHCKWAYSSCWFISTVDNIIKMINKISDELASNDVKCFEILRIGNYYVSDIGDYNKFTERPGQKIVKSTSSNINKVLNELFGKDKIFYKIGKKRMKIIETSYVQLNQDNQQIDMKTFYLQKIIQNNMSLFRAYSNGYYWVKNKYADMSLRNLGFYNPIQTDIAIHFMSIVIDWLIKQTNMKRLTADILKFLPKSKNIDDSIQTLTLKLIKDLQNNTNCMIELFILNQINDIPIVVYDEYHTIMYIFDNGLIYDINNKKDIATAKKYSNKPEFINIRFILNEHNTSIEKIEVIYFKD